MTLPLWRVARNRSVLAGAFVTAFSYSVIGFLEVQKHTHVYVNIFIQTVYCIFAITFIAADTKKKGVVEKNDSKSSCYGSITSFSYPIPGSFYLQTAWSRPLLANPGLKVQISF